MDMVRMRERGRRRFCRSYSKSPSWSSSSSSNRLITSYQDQGINDGIDRISELPDLVLHHILCFMDIEDVIRNTNILSKRWRNLWKSLTVLNFRRVPTSFPGFVDRVLFEERDHNSVLKSLRITYYLRNFYTPDDEFEYNLTDYLKDWMQYAANNVEELCLHFHLDYWENRYDLMWPKFSKIQVFKIKARDDLYMPRSLFLDCQLKSLKLEYVSLRGGNKVLTLSCSVLENLTISNCSHDYRLELLDISAPKLNNLELINDHTINDKCKLQISTPNLTSLILEGIMYKGYSFKNISSLVKAKFECNEVHDADMLRNILESLHKVTTLELYVELQTDSVRLDRHLLNTFVNLKCLKLTGWSGESCMHTIHSLLMNSYSLEALALEINHVRDAQDWKELFPCIYGLKSFEIMGVECCEKEVKLFEYILNNAVVLEEFTIYGYRNFRREECEKFNMKIHSLPRASSRLKSISLN